MMVLHAGYERSFISGIWEVSKAHIATGGYHREMDLQTILKWLNKVIFNLPLKILLVMENVADHKDQIVRPPVGFQKILIQKLLTRHMVSWGTNVFKVKFYALVKKHTKASLDSKTSRPETPSIPHGLESDWVDLGELERCLFWTLQKKQKWKNVYL